MTRCPRSADVAIATGLLVVQAFLVGPLFTGELTQWRESIEAAFIADARFITLHFPDLSWDPSWYLGFPFELFYTPFFHAVVAALGAITGDIPHAYRIVSASGYALGAPAVYSLARALGMGRRAGVLATAIFAVAPSASGVFGGLFDYAARFTGTLLPLPWRLQVMVEFGEGPHVLGLTLALFATAALLAYLKRGRAWRYWVAVALFLAVALTNLIALFGAAVLGLGCVVASGERERATRALRVAGAAALLSLSWYTPGFAAAVSGFSASGGDGGDAAYLLLPIVLGLLAIPSVLLARRHPSAATVLFWCAAFAAVIAAWYATDRILAPQPRRYALELDAAAAIAVAGLLSWASRRSTPSALARSITLPALAVALVAASLPGWAAVRPLLEPDTEWTAWSEREVALWLQGHLGPGERAYLSGDHAFWLNVFSDVPQVRGGVDFAAVDPWWAHAGYQINAGTDPSVSVKWLRALGVRYVVVTGPASTEIYKDFSDPGMFDGVLPLAVVIQGARIYEVAAPQAAPALVAHRRVPVPRDALDAAALDSYLGRLDAGLPGARLQLDPVGLGGWDGNVVTTSPATLLLRTAFDGGWRVWIDQHSVAPHADELGLLAIDLDPGIHSVRIDHRVHADLALGNAVAFGFLALLALRRLPRTRLVRRAAAPAALVGAVVAIAFALGLVGGTPKGTDAAMHLGRLRFVADAFPHYGWLYSWSAGMPAFDSYPVLPYLLGIPFVRTIGEVATLELFALLAFAAFALGIYGHLVERGRPREVALVAALMAIGSMATWAWVLNGGAYARPIAAGFGALAWWSHARAARTGSGRAYGLTAVLLAAALSSHQVMGAIAALYVAAVHMSAFGARGVPRLSGLAALTGLLAAPTILPAIGGGIGGRFLGVMRPDLLPSAPDVLFDPVHVGLAAFVVPLALMVAELPRRPGRVIAGAVALGAAVLYVFAPDLKIPSQYFYILGFEPFSMTFFVALAGALAYAALAPERTTRRGRIALVVAATLVVVNMLVAVPAYAAHRSYPAIVDTTEPSQPEAMSQRTLVVDGADLRHRLLPLTASESVWFSYRYRKPILRDYYESGRLHPDWIAWAYNAVYSPTLADGRFSAAVDWFAIDELTVDPALPAEVALVRRPDLRLIPSTAGTPFEELTVTDPSPIVVATRAPLVVIVADERGYDRTARALFDQGASPRTQLPVWWSGTLADLPEDLGAAAAAVLVVGARVGPSDAATSAVDRVTAHGGRVVWDLGGVSAGPAEGPWPASAIEGRSIQSFDIRDAAGRIDAGAFSSARYGDGAWGAMLPSLLREDARTELALDTDAVIATSERGSGRVTMIGGNLIYHATANGNAAELAYVLSFLGPAARDAAVEPAWTFVDPDHRVVETDGTPIVLKESIHRDWTATWRAGDGATRPLGIHYAGPAVMLVLPPGPGTVTFAYGAVPSDLAAWLLFSLGLLALAAMTGGGRLARMLGRPRPALRLLIRRGL